jgi:outer membrane protein assembly factor BamB
LALIELDLTGRPDHPPTPRVPPAHRYRTTGLLLAVLLVFVLGGAAAPDALRWRYLGAVPSPPSPESPFQIDGDRVYTAGGAGDTRTVTAWTLAKPPVRQWSVPFPARELGPDQVAYGDVRAQRAGDVVLITDGPDTTAVDARTGATRWHTDIGVRPLTGDRIGLEQDPQFRPYTEYNQDGGAPGQIFFSASGVPHDEAPIATDLRGIDLRTGATVWTAKAAGSVEVFSSGGALVLESGRLTLRSAETGAVLRTTRLPRLAGQDPDSGQLVGDVVLISYGAGDSRTRQLVGYSVRTFRQLWQVPEARVLTSPGFCVDLICADEESGVAVLDPATGRPLWHGAGRDLIRVGDDVLDLDSGTGDPVRVADPVNGDQRLRLSGWHYDLSTTGDGPVLLRRTDSSRASLFAAVEDDPAGVKPLGTSHGVVSDCASNERFVVCRGTGVLQVFAYRG